jgi:hypothetical protein
MVARVVADLVREHDVDLAVGEAAVEQRVPQHHAPGRADPERECVRLAGLLAHRLHAERDPVQSLGALEPLVACDQPGVVRPLETRVDVRADEDDHRRDRRQHGGAGDPPPRPEPPREAHHDEQGHADGDERHAERHPVAEDRLEVAHRRDVVPTAPPELDHGERELREPDDRQAQHPEEHPRAERARRRLLREPAAVPCVEGERAQRDERSEHPEDEAEAFVPLCAVDEVAAEHRVDVDVGEGQTVGHHAGGQDPGEGDPARDQGDADRELERPHTTSAGSSHSAGSASGGGVSAGEESG